MVISNFRDLKVYDENLSTALVDITKTHWFSTKTETRTVALETFCWRFANTGRFCPGRQVDILAAKYKEENEAN